MSQRDYGGAALITGASSGIGEAFARRLAADGMDLVLVARRQERLEALAAELEAEGVVAHVIAEDLVDAGAPERISAKLQEEGVEVGLLINNAGIGSYGSFVELPTGWEARMVDLNCRAPVLLTGRFLPPMVERGQGGIIFVASVAAFQPTPFLAAYGASKAFDLMFAEALWAELQGSGVHVLALCPGYVSTGFQQVAGTDSMPGTGGEMSPEQVVEAALAALGRQPSVIPGALNKARAFGVRFLPRSTVAGFARRATEPPSDT